MFFRILKRDLKKKKAINLIILLFVAISTMLIAASVNTLLSNTNAVNNYLDRAGVPEYMVAVYDIPGEKEKLEEFFDKEQATYDLETYVLIEKTLVKGKENKNTIGAIMKSPEKYGKVYDGNGKRISLKDNEVAMSEITMMSYNVKEGDTISVTIRDTTKDFTVKRMYDAIYGTEFIGLNRFIVSDAIYNEFNSLDGNRAYFYYLTVSISKEKFNKDLLCSGFNLMGRIEGESIAMTYFFEKLTSIILSVVSVILVLIAFLVLRFTIVFTIQEEYREIGIMKAMGMKKGKIKGIYLTKYLFLNILGSIIGFGLSFPVFFAMTKATSTSILMQLRFSYVMASLIAVVAIVLVIEGFCYLCTRKIDKLSPITSIRCGKESETYKKSRKLKIHKHKASVSTQLALGDIISGFRRFFTLFLTFFLCTILLVIAFAATGTLKSDRMVNYFGLPEFDVHFYSYEEQGKWYELTNEQITERVKQTEKNFEDKGYEIDIYGEASSLVTVYNPEKDDTYSSIAIRKIYNRSIEDYPYTSGKAPILENEIALTKTMSQHLGVVIGEKVRVNIHNQEYELTVTGLYDSMYTIGGAEGRLSNDFILPVTAIASFAYYGYNCNLEDPAEKLNKDFDNYTFTNMDDYISKMVGSIRDKLDYITAIIIIAVSIVLTLIVFLLNKLLISRETPEIAMLKSLGFNNKKIYAWQLKRMAIIVAIALAAALILAYPLSYFIVPIIFQMMGAASVTVEISAFQVFVLTPIIFLTIIVIGTGFGVGQIKNVQVSEINNQE